MWVDLSLYQQFLMLLRLKSCLRSLSIFDAIKTVWDHSNWWHDVDLQWCVEVVSVSLEGRSFVGYYFASTVNKNIKVRNILSVLRKSTQWTVCCHYQVDDQWLFSLEYLHRESSDILFPREHYFSLVIYPHVKFWPIFTVQYVNMTSEREKWGQVL